MKESSPSANSSRNLQDSNQLNADRRPPRILFAWPGISGFYGPCWRFLSEERGVAVKAVCAGGQRSDSSRPYDTASLFGGLDVSFPPDGKDFDAAKIREDVISFSPDVMFITGWSVPVNRFLASDRAFSGIKKVLCLDMPWKPSFRKFAARFVLYRYLRNFNCAFVPGLSSVKYARWLGFGGRRPVYYGLLPVDTRFFGGEGEESPLSPPRRRSFLYVGRYSPEKGVDVLAEAYSLYSAKVGSPWPLFCAGAGALGKCLSATATVTDLGFVQTHNLPELYASHLVYILPSRSESWGVAMGEAAASGMPVICTDACGGRFDLVREGGELRNGIIVKAGSAESLASAMVAFHNAGDGLLCECSRHSRALASPFSLSDWADRVLTITGAPLR